MFQKACFDHIKRHRFTLITRRAQALPVDDPRRMAFFGRFGDKCERRENLSPLLSVSSVPVISNLVSNLLYDIIEVIK